MTIYESLASQKNTTVPARAETAVSTWNWGWRLNRKDGLSSSSCPDGHLFYLLVVIFQGKIHLNVSSFTIPLPYYSISVFSFILIMKLSFVKIGLLRYTLLAICFVYLWSNSEAISTSVWVNSLFYFSFLFILIMKNSFVTMDLLQFVQMRICSIYL